ncbi:MAG: hypothetical protein N3A66_10335, partial [Planctomycetota bacterium]|nr:hypothetical protein [Planctomycetota bacterium]
RIWRARKHILYTFGDTKLPYIAISESPRDIGDIVIRRGEVIAERPRIAIPGKEHDLCCEGFDFGELDSEAVPVFLMRRMGMPAARYVNKSAATTTERGTIEAIVERTINALDQRNDIRTGVIASPDRFWHLAVLLYAGQQALRSAPANVAEQVERWLRQGEI